MPDGATVLITGGTTTEAMLPHLAGRERLTVLTNGLNIAYHLARYPEISVVVLGGVLRHEEMSLLGPIAEHVLADFHVDIAFFERVRHRCRRRHLGGERQRGRHRPAHAAARRVALVALIDSSKFGRRGPVRVADVDDQISA